MSKSSEAKSPSSSKAKVRGGGASAWVRTVVDDVFGIDLRALAVMRILLGIILLRDLWVRSYDLVAFYSDRGALPREAILERLDSTWRFSLHMMNGEWQFQAALFCIHAVFAVMLLVGFRTKLAKFVCWIFVISLHARGSIQLQAGDVVLRLLLFWSLFLPLGARVSIDAMRSPVLKHAASRVVSVASAAFALQMAYIYFFTAILKSGRPWKDGSAVYYALSIDYFGKQPFCGMVLGTTPVIDVLGADNHAWLVANVWPMIHPQVPWGASALTFGTVIFEWVGPALLFLPFWRAPLRTLSVFGFIAMHLGFYAGLEIGLFPWICIAAWIALIPGPFWDRLGWTDSPTVKRPIRRERWHHNAFAFFFLLLVTNWNMSTIRKQLPSAPIVPSEVRWVGHLLRLDQNWNMFAPYPLKDDGWWVMPGRLVGGNEVDLWGGGEPKWVPVDDSDGHKPHLKSGDDSLELDRTQPELVSAMYPSQRWRKYMRNIWLKKYKGLRLYYGKHVCRQWNAEHRGSERLKSFKMVYMKQVTPKPGESGRIDPVQIWNHNCFGKSSGGSEKKEAKKTPPIKGTPIKASTKKLVPDVAVPKETTPVTARPAEAPSPK